MYELLSKICKGNATLADIDKLEALCYDVKAGSLCGLGQTAPNPVLATLKFFRDEYVSHIVDKKCPAGVCKALTSYEIVADKCRGCTACARKCPVGAISGTVKQAHIIDKNKCIKCGACVETCKFGAIIKK
ncbi:MAG: NADH-ubiquinone oxidoreductase-F iron-sulfur binding region domain-containing protein, partial [Oscillospiraceae bacterium]